ncbi:MULTISPECIES: chloride channel protein [unclassified Burkholderia]|uniref:chloride channel protein n=1 Tax=unclassified Burkholderia TaxID=2613784 RepID=UPI00075D3208|nr:MULTISPECIES: chloride channel protein [unclassified Burkholderia]KVG77879.1 chloride channel protein [Burkholderia sp. MSMB2040]KVH01178.1 chloride channel protein [Burkholderia sp. MSMB2041]
MQRPRLIPTLTRRTQRIWRQYGVFWLGAIAVGLMAVMYARLIDWGYDAFRTLERGRPWLPFLLTPAVAALSVWLTRRFFRGAEGSGIPQVIATLHAQPSAFGSRLLTLRILFGKILISWLGIVGGFTIGREGPTVQIGASLMFNLRRFYPRSNALIERQLVLAGAAAGLSAAFNTPLAGIVFAIEELSRSFSARASGVLITAIIIAGVIALGMNGNYTYFGTIDIGLQFPKMLAPAVLLTALVTGVAGGLFGWLLLNTGRWLPARLLTLYRERPIVFAAACGVAIAAVGVASGGTTFGSGYAQARGLLDGREQLPVLYPLLKMASMVASYLPGIPGGIFAPSLSIGAGFGNLLHYVFSGMHLPMLIALAMVGYLAAVTQSPITSFVIVMEMINGHALVISLMATALIASRVSRLFVPPLYETLAERYLKPPQPKHAAAAPAAAAPAHTGITALKMPEDAESAPADPLDTLRDDGTPAADANDTATMEKLGGANAATHAADAASEADASRAAPLAQADSASALDADGEPTARADAPPPQSNGAPHREPPHRPAQ